MTASISKDLLRNIPGWEQLYAVTCDGRVWAHPREWRSANGNRRSHNGMWLRPDASGPYLRVTHKANNSPSNLLICTHRYHTALHHRLERSPDWPQFKPIVRRLQERKSQ